MSARTHIKLLLLGTIAWAAFWMIGLPSYFQQYSATAMAWFDSILTVVLFPVFYRALSRVSPDRRLGRSLWMAFYFTVPLAIYDWFYCGVFLGHGPDFLVLYWYVSVYYVIPWVILPACALVLNRGSALVARDGKQEALGGKGPASFA